MAITKTKKKEILTKLQTIANKDAIVFVNFHGLPVTKISEIRSELGKSDISYFVAKKTLVKKAFGESKVEGNIPQLDGELAIAYLDSSDKESSNDLTAPARGMYKFQKQYTDALSILGGVFEGRFLDKTGMEEIAQIPSQDVLRGMFVNVINSPIQGFAMVLKAYADTKEN